MCSLTYTATGVVLLATSGGSVSVTSNVVAQMTTLQTLPQVVAATKVPALKEPGWLTQQKVAEAAAAARQQQSTIVTYDVTTKGVITANFAEFQSQANATLNDSRGWSKMGVAFQQVASGGMFTLVLTEADQVRSFSSGCSADYSCNVGRYVIINQDRWAGATSSWNQAGGSLRDYRHMVVNHETGHWLGHGHQVCGGAGQAAPVMQQQSIDLQGCTFNPWPLTSELSSTRLGIKRQ